MIKDLELFEEKYFVQESSLSSIYLPGVSLAGTVVLYCGPMGYGSQFPQTNWIIFGFEGISIIDYPLRVMRLY